MSRALIRWSGLLVVLTVAASWLLLSLLAPDLLASLLDHPDQLGDEAPIEHVQHVLLVALLLLWAGIAWRVRAARGPLIVALLMILQLVVMLGEELDWGIVGGMRGRSAFRNLRWTLRDAGVIPGQLDATVITSGLLVFMLTPLVPALRRRWRALAPVHADPRDGLALFAAPACFLLVWALSGQKPTTDLVQMSGYLVVLAVTLRIFRRAGLESAGSIPSRRIR